MFNPECWTIFCLLLFTCFPVNCRTLNKFNENRISLEPKYFRFWSFKILGVMWGPKQNLGPIDSAVLTFIGYKQTDRKTDRQAKYIDRRFMYLSTSILLYWISNVLVHFLFIYICTIQCTLHNVHCTLQCKVHFFIVSVVHTFLI